MCVPQDLDCKNELNMKINMTIPENLKHQRCYCEDIMSLRGQIHNTSPSFILWYKIGKVFQFCFVIHLCIHLGNH